VFEIKWKYTHTVKLYASLTSGVSRLKGLEKPITSIEDWL
jgi:hypothetical protein